MDPQARDDDFTVQVAELDLAGAAAGTVNLLSHAGRPPRARSRLALDDLAAAVDADGDRLWVEVGLQHGALILPTTRVAALGIPLTSRITYFRGPALARKSQRRAYGTMTRFYIPSVGATVRGE